MSVQLYTEPAQGWEAMLPLQRGLVSQWVSSLSGSWGPLLCRGFAIKAELGKKQKQKQKHDTKGPSAATAGASSGGSASSVPAVAAARPADLPPSRLLVNATSSALTEAHLGNYYCLQPALIPEAYNKLHQAFYAPPTYGPMPEGGKQGGRAGGCLGLQREMAAVTLTGSAASSSPTLMYRQITHKLVTQARASKGKPSRFLLGGQPGSGKSCALVSLVERLRAESWLVWLGRVGAREGRGRARVEKVLRVIIATLAPGWLPLRLVLYVPSARALMRGGYFQQRLDPSGQPLGTWDTLTSAQHVLLGMQAAHALQLSRLPLRLPASRQLVESAGRQGREGGLAGAAVEVVQQERQQAQRPLPAAGKGAGTSQGQVGEADVGAGTAQITGPMVGSTANGLEMPGKGGDSGSNKVAQPSLGSLVTVGLATDMDASLAVECVLALTAEMCAQASPDLPVLLALDDYNALYGPSDYGTYDIPPPSHVRRREQLRQQGSAAFRPGTRRGPLAPDTLDADELDHREMAGDEHEEQQEPEVEEVVGEQVRQAAARRFVLQGEDLTLARGMRLLQSPLAATGNAMVVGATSWSAGVSPLLQIPCHPAEATCKLEVPRYSQAREKETGGVLCCNAAGGDTMHGDVSLGWLGPVEVAHALYRYYEVGLAPHPPTLQQVQRVTLLTNGNGQEVLRLAARLPLASIRSPRFAEVFV
ncbi:hypothetical protein QJQ45_025797 [Haematococcus lacustris]|nr:hypothetical protein QJQ45_025797 [Haematococcus lacustris]